MRVGMYCLCHVTSSCDVVGICYGDHSACKYQQLSVSGV